MQKIQGLTALACLLAALGATLSVGRAAFAQAPTAAPGAASKETAVIHARGTFEVKMTPQATGTDLGRMTLDKTFHGDLEGTSHGEMLAAMTAVEGSAGYVAMERVTGTLAGRSGSFVLQHSGTMTRGAPGLSIHVVPDSATGELVGLAGTMTIEITGGKHLYDFAYVLPEVGTP